MIRLRTEMKKILNTYHDRVYYQNAPNDAKFPYIVYDFPNSFMNGEQEVFPLDVDVWDNRGDTTELEQLAGVIWKGLNYHRHLDQNMQFSLYRESRLTLDDDDPRIRRRKLIFQLRYFDRRVNE